MIKAYTSEKGSVILPTLLVIMIIVAAGSTYLSLAFNEYKTSSRNQDLQGAINLAEAGIEDAMLAMKRKSWTGWTTVTTKHYCKTSSGLGLGNGRTGTTRVYCSILDESAPIVFAEGEVINQYGSTKKQIRIDFTKKGLFANGLTAKDTVDFNGNNVAIDSYNSDDGDYHPSTNRKDKGSVGSVAVTMGAVSTGNADIWGYVMTGGGAPSIGSNGTILGEDSPSGIDVDWDRIATDFYADFPNVTAPSPSSPVTTVPADGTIGIPSATTPTYYEVSSYGNGNHDTLEVDGPVVLIVNGDIGIKGEIQVTNNGSLEIYISGDLDIGGNGAINTTNVPANLVIYGTSTVAGGQEIKLHGNGALKAAVYAPNANLALKGGGSSGVFMGAAVANEITMNGNYEFHYDEALGSFGGDGNYKIARWRELIDSDEKVPLDTPANMIAYAVGY